MCINKMEVMHYNLQKMRLRNANQFAQIDYYKLYVGLKLSISCLLPTYVCVIK